MTDDRRTLRPVLSVLVVLAALLMLQPDLGTTLVVGAIGIGLLTLAGVPLRRIGVVTAVAGAATLVLALRADYRRQRLLAFLDPSADPLGTGYQINQSLTGLASGGLLGVGLGASRAKWGFLPNAHTDFIYTVIGEELGLVGALAVIVLFVAFAFLAVAAARRAPDRFGMLLAGGVATWVSVQAFVNIGGCVGALPVTGLPLPFISFGGSAMVAVMAATGVLVNVARQGRPA